MGDKGWAHWLLGSCLSDRPQSIQHGACSLLWWSVMHKEHRSCSVYWPQFYSELPTDVLWWLCRGGKLMSSFVEWSCGNLLLNAPFSVSGKMLDICICTWWKEDSGKLRSVREATLMPEMPAGSISSFLKLEKSLDKTWWCLSRSLYEPLLITNTPSWILNVSPQRQRRPFKCWRTLQKVISQNNSHKHKFKNKPRHGCHVTYLAEQVVHTQRLPSPWSRCRFDSWPVTPEQAGLFWYPRQDEDTPEIHTTKHIQKHTKLLLIHFFFLKNNNSDKSSVRTRRRPIWAHLGSNREGSFIIIKAKTVTHAQQHD